MSNIQFIDYTKEERQAPPISMLFKTARRILGFSQSGIATALLVSNAHTIRRWEAGSQDISGAALVALYYMLIEISSQEADSVAEKILAEIETRQNFLLDSKRKIK